jgi:tetratricopeptide (TPR) repeat protein
LENTEKSLTFAGNLLTLQMANTPEADIKEWQANEAIECFNKALELNPKNLDTKIALASCYIDGTGEIMKGVGSLKEVTALDSMNAPANLLLGKLSVQSGQHEKAIKRLNVVLSQDSKNTEALYFLAETHKNMGNKEKAIEIFNQCKEIVNNPDFSAEIDNYIRSFN